MNFQSIPIWEKCLFSSIISPAMEIRKGKFEDKEVVVVNSKDHEFHVAVEIQSEDDLVGNLHNNIIISAMRVVGNAMLEKEFPGKWGEFMKMRKRYQELLLDGWEKNCEEIGFLRNQV